MPSQSMANTSSPQAMVFTVLSLLVGVLSPVIRLIVNKLVARFIFDASKELRELELCTIPALVATLQVVEEKRMTRSARDEVPRSDLERLDKMDMLLKSALYEAQDILDLVDYYRKEKRLHDGDDDSVWVEKQLAAASAWISRCKRSRFGRRMDVIRCKGIWFGRRMDVICCKGAQSLIQGWRCSRQNFELICNRGAIILMGGGTVLQCVKSWYQQLWQLLRRVVLRRSGVLLPVSIDPTRQPPCLEPIAGSVDVPADPPCRPAEEIVDEEEIVEETRVEQGEEEIQDGEMLGEESSEGAVGETSLVKWHQWIEEESSEDDGEGKDGEPTSLSILWYCARSLLTWYAKACFYRDWSYEIVGIKSDKKDASAVESLVGIKERICLKNRIKHIEDSLNSSKNSDLLNDMNSSSGTTKDNNKECSSEQKEIADMHRNIDQKVFGREDDLARISNMLRDGPDAPSKPYSVIGIHGITGSGKTTLARYVCEHEKDAGHFNPIMFIHVGKVFSLADIFCDMLEEIKQSGSSREKDLKSLKTELGKNLKDKRFLLVLDDVWVNDDKQREREILLDMLNAAALSGSRVLVTAQKADAAQALGAQKPFSIPDLKEEVYLSLFMHHARPDAYASDDDGEYKRVGCKIANRLHQSPIAAVTVGKQLQNKSISFWKTTSNLDVLNKTMGALWWSYQQLGVDITRCFAYYSIFPKGYGIKRDKLVRIWIAHGFVNSRSNAKEELEDVGHRYLDELLAFSFVQTHQKKLSFKKTEIFTVHDLLHELAERVCGSEFFRIDFNDPPKDIPRGVCHLFIETDNVAVAKISEKNLDFENLRTLFIKEHYAYPVDKVERNHELEKALSCLFMRLRKLRVLIIKLNFGQTKLLVPASIGRMKHLCYLSIRFRCFGLLYDMILPKTFSKLYHIQSIDIPPNLMESCPHDMANLIYLRHISVPLPCPNIERFKSLQTLAAFSVKEEQGYGLNQLMCLNKLEGTLRITGLRIVRSKEEALQARLANKERLRILDLIFNGGRSDPHVQTEVLEGLCPPRGLQELRIRYYKGSTYPTWMLSRYLHTLELDSCSQLESIPEGSQLLSGLRELCIVWCDWESLPQNMERLESLQTLELLWCYKIKLLPMLPLQSLKKIKIDRCRVLSKTCSEVGHTNWYKIQHIPEIEIDRVKYEDTVHVKTSDNPAEMHVAPGDTSIIGGT